MGDTSVDYDAITDFGKNMNTESTAVLAPMQSTVSADLMGGIMAFGISERFTEAHSLEGKCRDVAKSMTTTMIATGQQFLALGMDAGTAVARYRQADTQAQLDAQAAAANAAAVQF